MSQQRVRIVRNAAGLVGPARVRGRTGLADRVTTPYEGTATRPLSPGEPVETPLRLHAAVVRPEWVDYNDHMTESAYLLVFGDAADAFFRLVGIDEAYRAAGHSLYTAETHLHHRRELALGDPLTVSIRLLDVDDKRVHLWQEMHGGSGELVAAAEQLLVHVDMAAGRSAPILPEVAERLAAVLAAHRSLPLPPAVGRPMGIRRAAPESPSTPPTAGDS